MIKNITYAVAFPTSQVQLKGSFTPQPGVTAVIGPNGVGKTFTTIELTRYLLYGKQALRGSASDYKKLETTGTFVIRGAEYTIKRSAKKEELLDAAGTVLAVNAEAVTKKAIELMGYGLNVFDVCNAAVQKRSDIFGTMKPSERKRMIDEVVNITSTEAAEKACRNEAKVYKREAEALTRQLRTPEKPHKPVDYEPSSDLGLEYAQEEDRYNAAKRLTEKMGPEGRADKPAHPRPKAGTILELEQADADMRGNQRRRADLERIINAGRADAPYSLAQLEAAAERLTLQSIKAGEVECPKCGEEFVPGHGHVELPEGPDLTKAEIRRYTDAVHSKMEAQRASDELAKLPEVKDVSVELAEQRSIEAEWVAYERQLVRVNAQREANHDAMAKLKALGEVLSDSGLYQLRQRYQDAKFYEQQLAAYKDQKEQFDELTTEIAELGRLSDEFRKGGEALADARATLKALLAPTLSRVASSLLSDMTAGEYHTVVVDDEMEITVNGQALETLSGGNETVANIALRLALGQVLVSETFPVFLGDEMDAFADSEKRGAVANALRALIDMGHLQQIVMITHRSVDVADSVIDLTPTE